MYGIWGNVGRKRYSNGTWTVCVFNYKMRNKMVGCDAASTKKSVISHIIPVLIVCTEDRRIQNTVETDGKIR